MNTAEIEMMVEFHRHELMLDTREEDLRWDRWTNNVETMLGHSLDGDQEEDGYSIDRAHDFYVDGLSAVDATLEFKILRQ